MRSLLWLPLCFAAGCMAQPSGAHERRDGGTEDAGGLPDGALSVCDVARHVLVPRCASCHREGGQAPDLAFEAARDRLLGAASPRGAAYVVPGDPAGSYLFRKIAGTQGPDEGARMPPGPALDGALIALVERWIREGASADCSQDPGGPVDPPQRHHPEGFDDHTVHGVELKLGLADCRECHGADLTGGVGPSCDLCHRPGWRTNCVKCHGGSETQTGAPPRDLSGELAAELLSFRAHTAHVSASNHAPYECTQCHAQPEHVMSPGHVFDDTPGRAEVSFGAGLSGAGQYLGAGSCANLYCHGDGNGRLGAWAHDRGKPTCTTCHAGRASGRDGWRTMSGAHHRHLREGFECQACHAATAVGSDRLAADPSQHVDGQKTVVLQGDGMTRSGGTCSGTCHGERHDGRGWFDDD